MERGGPAPHLRNHVAEGTRDVWRHPGSGRAGRPPARFPWKRGGPASAVHRSGPGSSRPGWMRTGRCPAETAPPEACRGHYSRQPINRSMFHRSSRRCEVPLRFRGCAFSGTGRLATCNSQISTRNARRRPPDLKVAGFRLRVSSSPQSVVTMFSRDSGPYGVAWEVAGPAALHRFLMERGGPPPRPAA